MIGQIISHYKILEKLGGGGMGVVYKAEDTKLKRTVALKFLPSELTHDVGFKKRFIHEAQAASALQHNNICTIHEIDESEDGKLFICMDCYEGETLKDRIASRTIPVGEAVDIVIQVAEGLEEAHKAGMVHRDIKPANIVVTRDGVVKILDFGLAKLVNQTRVTKTGMTVGTVAYMSPEQARGEEVDARSDIFSLGAVLYELLAGSDPFHGDHEAAVMYRIMNNDPAPLVERRRDVPAGLQSVIDRALQKDVGSRYRCVSDFISDLEVVEHSIAGSKRKRRRMPALPRGDRAGRSKRTVFALAAAVVFIGAVVTFFVPRLRTSTPNEDNVSLAIVEFRDLATPDDLVVSASMTELVNIGLIESSPIRVVSSEYLHDLRRRLFGDRRGPIEDEQALEVARKAGATLLLAGRIGQMDGRRFISWRLVDTESGENLAARRLEENSLVAAANEVINGVLPLVAERCGVGINAALRPVDDLTTGSSGAYRHYMNAVLAREWYRTEEALDELTQAVALDSTFALAYFELGRLYWATTASFWDFDASVENLERAWSLRSRLGIKDRLRLEGFRYDMDRRLARAVDTYKEILKRWPDDRETLRDLSNLLYRYWDNRGAVQVHEAGKQLYPDDPVLGGPEYFICLVYLGSLEDALRVTKTYVDSHSDEPSAWGALASRYLSLGLPDSAEVAYRKAQSLDPDWGDQSLGYCAYHAGDLDKAITVFEQVLDREDLRPSRRHWLMMWSHGPLNMAALYREAGRYQRVLDVCEEARRYVSGDDNITLHQFVVGRLLLWVDRPQEALDVANELSKRDDTVQGQWYGLRLRARAQAANGDLEAAHAAVKEIYAAQDRWGSQARSIALEIDADIALAENNPEAALEFLEQKARIGVPEGLYRTDFSEAVARAHQMAGRVERAVEIHKELLRVYGGHALSHYELGQLYDEMSRPSDAAREYTRFLEMWSLADEGLPQLVDARERLAALESSP